MIIIDNDRIIITIFVGRIYVLLHIHGDTAGDIEYNPTQLDPTS